MSVGPIKTDKLIIVKPVDNNNKSISVRDKMLEFSASLQHKTTNVSVTELKPSP